MMNPYATYKSRFFAAANGADGFKSYFDSIFSSERLDGVFILKGGPGTGKSTLLREIASHFSRPDIQVELFHCSSDPTSLDGVLLLRGDRSACVLDGTAPHERDARLPGAVDEIVNLGDCFETKRLKEKKREILSLQMKKSLAYKDAYFYLTLFGAFAEKIKAEAKSRLDENATKEWIFSLFSEKTNAKNAPIFAPRPIGAFCKDGIVRLDAYERIAEKTLRIYGDGTECGVLLSFIKELLSARGYGGYYAPSPLLSSLTDGLFLKDEKTAFIVSDIETEDGIYARRFFSLGADAEEIKRYESEAARLLRAAKDSLSAASVHHFALEKIYTPAMRFEALAPIKKALFQKIGDCLSL